MVTQDAPQSKTSTSTILTLTSTWVSRMRKCIITRKFSLSSYTHPNRICIRTIYRLITIVILLRTSSTSSSKSKKLAHAKTKSAQSSSFCLKTLSSSLKRTNLLTMPTLFAHSSKKQGSH